MNNEGGSNKNPETDIEKFTYTVGYKKPPEHSRFQKGQSGNKKGRPKASKNLKTETIEELSEKVKIRIGERQVRVSKHRALLKMLTLKALRGDARSINTLLNLMVQVFGLEGLPAQAEVRMTTEELAALELFEKRLLELTGDSKSNEEKGEEEKE